VGCFIRPKSCGGWGFRNLIHFNTTLNANTLWRVLTQDGIWHRIVMDKYLHQSTIENWLRNDTFHLRSASRIWNNLLKSIHIITHWLSWLSGSGNLISVGNDFILGLRDKVYSLSGAHFKSSKSKVSRY
jgi:hypothetical protein